MIRSVCCVCGIQYATKHDGAPEILNSHGFCEVHHNEAMANIISQFPEIPEDWECLEV